MKTYQQETIGGEEVTDSKIVIMHQEEPTTGDGEMTSSRTTMSLQVANGLYQMSNES